MTRGRVAAAALAAWCLAGAAAAQPDGPRSGFDRADIWDLALGMDVRQVPRLDFQDYRCGTAGGPGSIALDGFAEFGRCPPDANGLREVQFRYDDEQEFIARAWEAEAWIERLEGTRPFGAPSIVSALIDDAGHLRGLRIATDDRVPDDRRAAAWSFAYAYKSRFGLDGWNCVAAPPDEARRPVGDAFADERCTKQVEGLNLVVTARHFRRPGHAALDPVSGRITSGQFESSARLEIYQPPYGPPSH